jgi:predicted metal-dependent HD superfamily phosphohydrolase
LVAAYSEPHRAYHTLDHLAECFAHLDASPVRPEDAAAVELALWFHDPIYDTKAADNEARSAHWARRALAALPSGDVARIADLILVTKHDAEPATPDEELLLDIDLAILGATPERFAEYERQIRNEYAWVPDDAYRAARARILDAFARRDPLYHTSHFRETLGSQARTNLRQSLARLD